MTDRLYYQDSYLTEFRARVLDAGPDQQRIYLDRTAFYPTSGGQPFDIGQLGGSDVIEVIDEGDRIAHVLSDSLSESEVDGRIVLTGNDQEGVLQRWSNQDFRSDSFVGRFEVSKDGGKTWRLVGVNHMQRHKAG